LTHPLPERIAYFISGHGYGHAVRSVQLINALSGVNVTLFTTIEKKYFEHEINTPFDYQYCELDCGCIQSDALEIDIQATYQRYSAIQNQRDIKIADCKKQLISKNIEFIISDIVPIAFTIAKQLGLPSLAISNFTWVEIYDEYISTEPNFKPLIASIRQDYSNADFYARLYPGLEQHPFSQYKDMDLLCRHNAKNKDWLFHQLGIEPSKKLCLIYIGQYGLHHSNWQKLSEYKDWVFIGIYPLTDAPNNYHQINLNDSPIQYSDLVANCDLILAKLGYGIVAECLYWKKPVIYPPRKLFSEYKTLEKAVIKTKIGYSLSLRQLQNCDLDKALNWAANIDLQQVNYDTAQSSIIKLIRHIYQANNLKENS